MGVKLVASSGGSVELVPTNTASNFTVTVQAATGTVLLNNSSDQTINGLTVGKGAGAVATNTAVGASALAANTTASNNTAVGYQAGYTNSTGASCTFLGYTAGFYTTGTKNIFLGTGAGSQVTSGASNTFIGAYNGNQAGLNLTTASNYIVLSDGDGNPRIITDGSGRTGFNGLTPYASYNLSVPVTPAANAGIRFQASTTGTSYAMEFYTSDNASHGYISYTTSGTSYNTTSDYRLKHDIAPMTCALAKVAALKPCTYKWNSDNSDGEGFIAHELAETCPQAVTGEKDAVNEDGSIRPQGIDTSFLVATLTAAIQEQQAIITSLTDRITALENK